MFFIIYAIVVLVIQLPLTILNYFLVKNKIGYFRQSAVNIDRYGNREFRATWNTLLITPQNFRKFGNINETISEILGHAVLHERQQVCDCGHIDTPQLTKAGKILVKLLTEKHCTDATLKNIRPIMADINQENYDKHLTIGVSAGYILTTLLILFTPLGGFNLILNAFTSGALIGLLVLIKEIYYKNKIDRDVDKRKIIFSAVGSVVGGSFFFMAPVNIFFLTVASIILLYFLHQSFVKK